MQILFDIIRYLSIAVFTLIAVYMLGRMFGLGFSKSWQPITGKRRRKDE
jgi:hypothetical protein